jgi:photosystem II stability/assembly factor-like uncharacterized protein
MKRILTAIIFLLSFSQANAQWFNLTSPTTTYLYSTWFANYDTGYAVGGNINSSIFLKTTDGGSNWGLITNIQTQWLYDVVFLNDTTGLACGYDGAMYKTTDAGVSWVAKPSQTTAWLYSIAKKPDGTVYATGQDGALIKSVNSGDNWTNVNSNSGQTMLDLQFYDNNYGVAAGYNGEMIYTTDGGNNWAIKLMGTSHSITGVWMLSPDTIFTCALAGNIYKTTNAGNSFTFVNNSPNDLNAIFFTDDNNGYVVGNQKIYQTTNGGGNWYEMTPLPTANGLKDIFVSPDNRVMYAVGNNGSIIKNINTIGIEETQIEELNIYPNPTSGIINVPVKVNSKINFFDAKGNLVKSFDFINEEVTKLNIADLAEGTYIVQYIQNKNTSYGRIILKK